VSDAVADPRGVLDAAANVVAAFAANDTAAYFGAFTREATFIFHNVERVLASRADYELLWQTWQRDNVRVLQCDSYDASVTFVRDDVAIFHHRVHTTWSINGEISSAGERETIVFHNVNGFWRGVHEHLSPDPTFVATPQSS
jgi:ketosteroid isomerase-like protein